MNDLEFFNNLDQKTKKRHFIKLVFTELFILGTLFINHFLFFSRSDRSPNNTMNWIQLSCLCLLFIAFAIADIWNILISKNRKLFLIMDSIIRGVLFFALLSCGIAAFTTYDGLKFIKEYISLYISSFISLLGFSIAIVAILTPPLIREIKKFPYEKKINMVFSDYLQYFLFFFVGLIYTISLIINLQDIDLGYYKIIIFRAMLYSCAQIIVLIFKIIKSIIKSSI